MSEFLSMISVTLLATLALGLVRVWRGPTAGDRMLSVLLSGTTGVGVLLVLAVLDQSRSTLDVALVLAVLAPIAAVAFVSARRQPVRTRRRR